MEKKSGDAPSKNLFLKLFFLFAVLYWIESIFDGKIDMLAVILGSVLTAGFLTLIAWKIFKVREK
ncbi:MAG: hypothetical protein WC350_05615 [Candidatus Micrarchaeia archaeon]|jgi:hypothetical protein